MNEELAIDTNEEIKNLIYTVRGKQVMLDSDIAMLFKTETRAINQAVKRNMARFPENFGFQLTDKEFLQLRSQTVIFNSKINNGNVLRKYNPYVFTEQGIIMLSGILRSDVAIEISVRIVEVFVEMRKFLRSNGQIFERLTALEYKQLEHNKKIDIIFDQLQQKQIENQRVFFEGQIYDAYSLIIDIIERASRKIVIIDNYADKSILDMLTKKKKDVEAVIITSTKNNKIQNLDIKKFNEEYPTLKIAKIDKFHDRFIILDNKELYHCGASLKDLGKKCFGINKIDDDEIIKTIIKL